MPQNAAEQDRNPGAGTVGGTRSDEMLVVHAGGIANHLFISRWIPPGKSRGTLLCLHALTTTRLDFEAVAEALSARGLTVVCPDMPSHGRSRWVGNPAEMGSGGPCGGENFARCLLGLLQHYAPDPGSRYLLGTSWSAVRLALILARGRIAARGVVFNDMALEHHPALEVLMQRIPADLDLSFDTLDEGVAYLDQRHRELLGSRDTDSIAPAILRRYLASQLMERDGRFVIASNPFHEGMSREIPPGYPDMHATLSAIAADKMLLAFGTHSPYRDSATHRRILQTLPNVRGAEIPGAGHPPRLLTPYEWKLLGDFLLEP